MLELFQNNILYQKEGLWGTLVPHNILYKVISLYDKSASVTFFVFFDNNNSFNCNKYNFTMFAK
tara:strand:+ start:705 stop:896 length:192 start_codon:yes stop_codon:yes gene_type:complete